MKKHARKNIRDVVRPPTAAESPHNDALAVALRQNDWERAALLLLLGVSMAARSLPDGDIDDLLSAIDGESR